MHIIDNEKGLADALASSLDPHVKALLKRRSTELLTDAFGEIELGDLVKWILVGPGDTLAAIETATGYPFRPAPPWEWVLDHQGAFEVPIIVSDDGYGVVLIVPDRDSIDATLRSLLREEAELPTSADK